MVGTAGSITQEDIYELNYRAARRSFQAMTVGELEQVIEKNEQFDESLAKMSRLQRFLIKALYIGIDRPGKNSPEYKAAIEVRKVKICFNQ